MLTKFLEGSRATEGFRRSIATFLSDARPNAGVSFDAGSPPVKVERTLTKLLEAHPELEIDRVEIEGRSGCEFFRGEMRVHAGDGVRRVEFHWDCRWRAERQGWTDYFGYPDQTRAAREFGYDCFRRWEVEARES